MIEGLGEALAWRRGEISLPVRIAASMTPERIKAIRKAVAKSPKDFAKRFGIPARTLEGWEQGRRQPDPAASVLLRVIEKNPDAVEAALA
jgi:putative transcriptional regulator